MPRWNLYRPDGSGPIPNKLGTYELIACTRHEASSISLEDSKKILQQIKEALKSGSSSGPRIRTEFDNITDRIYKILTTMANFSFETKLEPNEMAEIPGDQKDPSCCLIFDEFHPGDKSFEIEGKSYGLLLCIEIHRSEMQYAKRNGGKSLIDKLKTAGFYPYSDIERRPVI